MNVECEWVNGERKGMEGGVEGEERTALASSGGLPEGGPGMN